MEKINNIVQYFKYLFYKSETPECIDLFMIIDKSGSMLQRTTEVITSFNEFIGTQKLTPGSAVLSLYFFSTYVETVFECKSISDVEELTSSEYAPDGSTALYDAIGDIVKHKVSDTNKTIMIVITDGYENSSSKYSRAEVKSLVESKKNLDLKYVGSNQDAMSVGNSIGAKDSLDYTDNKLREAILSAGESISRGRSGGDSKFTEQERVNSGRI